MRSLSFSRAAPPIKGLPETCPGRASLVIGIGLATVSGSPGCSARARVVSYGTLTRPEQRGRDPAYPVERAEEEQHGIQSRSRLHSTRSR